jgi:hypothetical protein
MLLGASWDSLFIRVGGARFCQAAGPKSLQSRQSGQAHFFETISLK